MADGAVVAQPTRNVSATSARNFFIVVEWISDNCMTFSQPQVNKNRFLGLSGEVFSGC